MQRKIALIRGINVGGRRKIGMDVLKSLCEGLGWKNTTSYIQSGNLVFESDTENSVLEEELETAIKANFDFNLPVTIRTAEEIANIIRNNPIGDPTIDDKQLHVTFLNATPSAAAINSIKSYDCAPDVFEIIGKEVFIYCHKKYHQSKLSNNFFEKKLGVKATTRNWRTVMHLAKLSQEIN